MVDVRNTVGKGTLKPCLNSAAHMPLTVVLALGGKKNRLGACLCPPWTR